MRYDWLAGDAATALADPFSVVLTEKKARQYFGTGSLDGMIGRQIVYNDSLPVHVTGIVLDWPGHTDFPFNQFISLSTAPHSWLYQALWLDPAIPQKGIPGSSHVLVKLEERADPRKVGAALSALAEREKWLGGLMTGVELQPLSAVHFTPAVRFEPFAPANLLFLSGITIITTLLAGLYPARLLSAHSAIGHLPGIAAVARENMPPTGMDRGLFTIQYLARSEEHIPVEGIKADEHYLDLYNIRLLAGKGAFASDTLREVVINESLSKLLGFSRPGRPRPFFLAWSGNSRPSIRMRLLNSRFWMTRSRKCTNGSRRWRG
jgi:hypothetical protein